MFYSICTGKNKLHFFTLNLKLAVFHLKDRRAPRKIRFGHYELFSRTHSLTHAFKAPTRAPPHCRRAPFKQNHF